MVKIIFCRHFFWTTAFN